MIQSNRKISEIRKILRHVFQFEYNFEVFCQFFLPKAFTKPFEDFHREIIHEFWDNDDDTLACPRGHGKSTLVGQGYVLHRICYKWEKYILYVSQNTEKSNQFLEPIAFEIKNNPRLKFIFPNIDIKKVTDEESGRDRQDCFDIGHELRVQAFSFEKNARGFKFHNQRPTLIIFDDIDDDQRVLNPDLRMKDYFKFSKQLIPALDAEVGKYKMIGTIIHLDCLLAKQLKADKGKIYRAFEFDDNNRIIPGTILFPSLFTVEKFENYIRKFGTLSARSEYLNDPQDNESSLIKREYMIKCLNHEISMDECSRYNFDRKILGVDFAFSDRVTADNSAFVSLGLKNEKLYLFQGSIKHGMSAPEQMDYIKQGLHIAYHYNIIALEENSIKAISKELPKWNLPLKLYHTGNSDEKEKTNKGHEDKNKAISVSKTNFIIRLGAAFENEKIVLPYKTEKDKIFINKLMGECSSFALNDGKLVEAGVHPDIPIALGYCVEGMGDYSSNEVISMVLEW